MSNRFWGSAAAIAFLLPAFSAVQAAEYPARPIRFVLGFPPGGAKELTDNGR